MHTVTCHNEARVDPITKEVGPCPSLGQPIEYDLTYPDQDTGEIRTVDAVMCGACNEPISDIEDPSEEPASA
ncbi:hypothetical protein JCM18899A_18880 [Nocardioides sp. AN3]